MTSNNIVYQPLKPTALRPLLGTTILLVEDSRFASDALRLMALRSGARIRRADCMASARRHLAVYRPTVVIIDVGLPDGDGVTLLAELAAATTRIPVIIGTSGDDTQANRTLEAGADGYLSKPLESLSVFQSTIIGLLPVEKQHRGPRPISSEIINANPAAYHDDLSHAADVLENSPDKVTRSYLRQFLSGLARTAHDTDLAEIAATIGSAANTAQINTLAARLKQCAGKHSAM